MMNRPRKITSENLDDILAYLKTHGVSETARKFGMNRVTLTKSLRPFVIGLKMILMAIGDVPELEAERLARKFVYGEDQQTVSLTYEDKQWRKRKE